ncbi:protein of unknown function (plasmid) [Caballeronia sp. S22]
MVVEYKKPPFFCAYVACIDIESFSEKWAPRMAIYGNEFVSVLNSVDFVIKAQDFPQALIGQNAMWHSFPYSLYCWRTNAKLRRVSHDSRRTTDFRCFVSSPTRLMSCKSV